MTALTPQAELSAAADKIRKLAEAATAGVCPDFVYWAVRHIARNCDIECGHDEHEMAPTWDRHDDSPYIAAMGPDVGLALAEQFAETAPFAAEYPELANCKEPDCDDFACALVKRTLALARAINGAVRP